MNEINTRDEPLVEQVDEMTIKVTMDDGSKRQLKYMFSHQPLDTMSIYMNYGFKDERMNFGCTKIEFPWNSYTLEVVEIEKENTHE